MFLIVYIVFYLNDYVYVCMFCVIFNFLNFGIVNLIFMNCEWLYIYSLMYFKEYFR